MTHNELESCQQIRYWLSLYYDDLNSNLRVKSHLAGCDGCRSLLNQLNQVSTTIRAIPEDTLSPVFHESLAERLRSEADLSRAELSNTEYKPLSNPDNPDNSDSLNFIGLIAAIFSTFTRLPALLVPSRTIRRMAFSGVAVLVLFFFGYHTLIERPLENLKNHGRPTDREVISEFQKNPQLPKGSSFWSNDKKLGSESLFKGTATKLSTSKISSKNKSPKPRKPISQRIRAVVRKTPLSVAPKSIKTSKTLNTITPQQSLEQFMATLDESKERAHEESFAKETTDGRSHVARLTEEDSISHFSQVQDRVQFDSDGAKNSQSTTGDFSSDKKIYKKESYPPTFTLKSIYKGSQSVLFIKQVEKLVQRQKLSCGRLNLGEAVLLKLYMKSMVGKKIVLFLKRQYPEYRVFNENAQPEKEHIMELEIAVSSL